MTTTLSSPDPARTASGAAGSGGSPSTSSGFSPAAAKKQRRLSARFVVVAVFVALAAVFGLTRMLGQGSSALSADSYEVQSRSFPVLLREKGELKAAKSIDIKSQVEGRSTIIWLIEEGAQAKEGDILVKLASDQIEEKVRSERIKETNASASAAAAEKEYEILIDQNASDLRKAELDQQMMEIELQKYRKGDWEETQLDIALGLSKAQKVLVRAKQELEDSQHLHEQQYVTKGDLYRDEIAWLEADIAVKKAELKKKTTLDYIHPQELQKRQSDVDESRKDVERVRKSNAAKESKALAELEAKKAEHSLIQDRLNKFNEQQANCEIKAPQGGLVVYDTGTSRWDRRQIAEGAEVFERQTIIKLPDPTVMMMTVRIHEANTDKIAIGQVATVEVEGIPGKIFTGKVTKIAPLADSQNQWLNPDLKEYETEITLEGTDPNLKPGVTARADIVVTRMSDVLAVPVQAVFSKAGHNYVFRHNRGDSEPIEVEVGMSSDEFAEIKSGLTAGDEVLLAISDALRRKLPDAEDDSKGEAEPPSVLAGGSSSKNKGKGSRRPAKPSDAKSS